MLGNPGSGRFARRRAALRAAATRLAGDLYREGSEPARIGQAAGELVAGGADIIIVLGGDGTLQAVLDHLSRTADRPPPLAIVPCGTTNMAALDLGCGQAPLRVIEHLQRRISKNEGLPLVARRVLRVSRDNAPPLHGMFFGAGIITAGVRYFREHVRGGSLTGEGASALAVLRMVLTLARGAGSGDRTVARARISEDGAPSGDGDFLLLLASTLDRLLLGSRPYWGREPAPIHYTAIRERPARLWRSLPGIVRGRGVRFDGNDYRSRNLRMIELQTEVDFVLDGEIHAVRGRGLRIDSVGPVHFAVS